MEHLVEQTGFWGAPQAKKIKSVFGGPAETETHIGQGGSQQREVPAVEHDEAVADLAVDEFVVIERDAVLEDLFDKAHGKIPATVQDTCGGVQRQVYATGEASTADPCGG